MFSRLVLACELRARGKWELKKQGIPMQIEMNENEFAFVTGKSLKRPGSENDAQSRDLYVT